MKKKTLTALLGEALRSSFEVEIHKGSMSSARAESLVLKMLNLDAYCNNWVHDRINSRAMLANAIYGCAEDGKVALVESGMDCDCVQYDGRVHLIDANLLGYRKKYNDIQEWSDGTFYLRVEKPSIAAGEQYRSRDRALEAYEDGHLSHVTWGSLDD